MPAEFYVVRCFELSSVGLVLAGTVESGEIREGAVGQTFKGKKFTLIKIEKEGSPTPTAKEKDKVTIYIKNIARTDLKPGDSL